MVDATPSENDSNLRLNQRRAVILRWWLLTAVTLAVSSVPTLLDVALPRVPMFVVFALMTAFNGYVQWRMLNDEQVSASELFSQLCVDLVALAILLYLSGGAANPLISFLFVPVAVAALSLPGTLTAAVALLAIASSAGSAASVSIQRAMIAPARFTNDSMASDRRPTEPVSFHATPLSKIVAMAAAMDSQA